VKEFIWPRAECSGEVCEHGNVALDPINVGEFLDNLSDFKPIKKNWIQGISNTITGFIMGFEVITAVVMKGSVFWGIRLFSPLKVNRRFGRTLHFQAGSNPCFEISHDGFMIGSFFDTDDGYNLLLRNVVRLSTEYKALYHRRQNSSPGFIICSQTVVSICTCTCYTNYYCDDSHLLGND
jgi:hypothetical protein